jgi:hypothetical protein
LPSSTSGGDDRHCDPRANALYYAPDGELAELDVGVEYDFQDVSGRYEYAVGITFWGELPTTFPVTQPLTAFPEEGGAEFFFFGLAGPTCPAGAGSITITAAGVVGERVEGSYSVSGLDANPGCPSGTLTGSFSVIRDDKPGV